MLKEVEKSGALTALSWKNWLAAGVVPGIPQAINRRRDLSNQDVATMSVFEQVAGVAGIELAQDMTRLAGQKIRAGILTPVIATRGDLSISVDLFSIVERINRLLGAD